MLGFSELLGWALKSTGCGNELLDWTKLQKETPVVSVKAVMVSALVVDKRALFCCGSFWEVMADSSVRQLY